MAITGFSGTTQLDDSVQAERVSPRVAQTAYSTPIQDNFVGALGRYDFVSGSKTVSYTRLNALSAAAFVEGDDNAPTALGDTQRSLTVALCGLGVAYGDTLRVAQSTPQGKERVQMMMMKAYAQYVDNQLLALNTSFTSQIGDAAQPWSSDKLLQAIHVLEVNEVDGPFFSTVYSTAVHNLRQEVGSPGSNTNPVFMRPDILSRIGPAMQSKYALTMYEVDHFISNQCPTTSTTGKTGGLYPMNSLYFPMIRLIGVDNDGPFGGQPWDMRYEEQRDASGLLTEMWVSGYWATGLDALDYGVGLLSVA